MYRNEFTNAFCGFRARVRCRLDCANIASNHYSNISCANLLSANQRDIRRLNHCVSRLNRSNKPSRFNQSQSFIRHFVKDLPSVRTVKKLNCGLTTRQISHTNLSITVHNSIIFWLLQPALFYFTQRQISRINTPQSRSCGEREESSITEQRLLRKSSRGIQFGWGLRCHLSILAELRGVDKLRGGRNGRVCTCISPNRVVIMGECRLRIAHYRCHATLGSNAGNRHEEIITMILKRCETAVDIPLVRN